jgi:FKBP-type peptidyl-prolyl cis-trans isomerase
MTLGSKYVFYIPSNLAYGDEQMGPKIAPGSTLVFEVELLGVN